MELIDSAALAAGLAWASGIRLYAGLFFAGLLAKFGLLTLPPALTMLSHDWVLGASGLMLAVEFFADKIPGLDSLWDAVHTFIRIPAGGVLAAGAMGSLDPTVMAIAGILGGTIASGAHATKAGTRAMLNASPEPFSNWAASVTEDVVVPIGLWTAIKWPLVFFALLAVFMLMVIWLLPKLWRGLRWMFARVSSRAADGDARV